MQPLSCILRQADAKCNPKVARLSIGHLVEPGELQYAHSLMKRSPALALLLIVLTTAADAQKKEAERVVNAGKVIAEILDVPDNLPQELLDKAECAIVLPGVLKFAIGLGGSYGRGVMTCRGGAAFNGSWGAPTMIALEGGSFGLQLGGQAIDFVLLVMNQRGAQGILSSKVKLGADAAAAAGPKGRNAAAATDVTMRAEILTYSRTRGFFAGVSLEGSTLRPDGSANEKLYGKEIPAKDIVLHGGAKAPASAKQLIATLNAKSPKNKSQ